MKPGTASNSRVFLIEGGARPDHDYSFEECMRGGPHAQDFGDVTPIRCPSPDAYGQYVDKGEIPGDVGRPTNTITGLFSRDTASTLHRLARLRCPIDVQLHFGQCQSPKAFDELDKALIYEGASLTNYNTDELGALEPGENAKVGESADISAQSIYEYVPMNFAERANSVVTNEVVDVIICDGVSCGECESQSDGCKKIYAITLAAGGSAGTPPDLVFSLDKGANYYAHDIDTLTAAQDPTGIACVGDYLVVTSNAANSISYVLKDDVKIDEDEAWTETTTGFVTGGEPNAIDGAGNIGFIVGDAGYIYKVESPADGVTVLDAGSATTNQLNDVCALDENFAVAVGNSGTIVKTENGTVWTLITPAPVGVGVHFNCVELISEDVWFIGASNGYLYWTVNGGSDFSYTVFSGLTTIEDIKFVGKSIGRLVGYDGTPRGKIYETINGGKTWKILPRGKGTLNLVDHLHALAVCQSDENFMVTVGLNDNGTDGVVLQGED